MRSLIVAVSAFLLLAPQAFADPILNVTPSSIALSPTQTVVTFSVDPNGSLVSGIQVSLSSLSSGLQMLSIGTTDPEIGTSGPATIGPNDEAGFLGTFAADRSTPFTVGTVTVLGITAGTPLVASGSFVVFDGSGFNSVFFGPTNVSTVVPEPTTAALIGIGLALLAARRRSVL